MSVGHAPSRSHALSRCGSIDDLSPQELAPLCRGRSFYVNPAWLAAVEHARGGNVHYVCARDPEGTLVGVLPVYDESPGRYHLLSQVLRPSGVQWNEADWTPAAVVGTQAGYATEFLLDAELDEAGRGVVLDLLLAEASRETAMAALHLTRDGVSQLADAGVAASDLFTTGGTCAIDVRSDSFDDYTRRLGRHGRVVRRERRRFDDAGYDVVTGTLEEFVGPATTLCTQLQRKYGERDSGIEERRRYMSVLAERTGDLSRVTLLRRDGKDAAIAIAFELDDTLYQRQLGFDYDVTGDAFEYFFLAFYDPVEHAIKRGLSRIDLGIGSYRAKVLRGAGVEALRGLARSRRGRSPLERPDFRAWENERAGVVERGIIEQLEAAL